MKESTPGGPHPVHEGGGTPTPYIHVWGEKNEGEGFIAFYDTEPPPNPNLSWDG